jgi:hypothetical protein
LFQIKNNSPKNPKAISQSQTDPEVWNKSQSRSRTEGKMSIPHGSNPLYDIKTVTRHNFHLYFSFDLYIKFLLVVGVWWLFFTLSLLGIDALVYISRVFNVVQGPLVFCVAMCRTRVAFLFKKYFCGPEGGCCGTGCCSDGGNKEFIDEVSWSNNDDKAATLLLSISLSRQTRVPLIGAINSDILKKYIISGLILCVLLPFHRCVTVNVSSDGVLF